MILSPENTVDLDLAYAQGNLFEYAAKHDYDVFAFIETFMNDEDTAMHLDIRYSWLQIQPPHIMLSYLPHVKAAPRWDGESRQLDPETAWWIGYAYRLLCRKKNLASRDVVKALPVKLMTGLHAPYHTFTNDTYLVDRLYQDYLARE